MHALRTARNLSRNAGAVVVFSIIAFVVLILVVALVIDGGLIYSKRAEISKAVDAAAIAGINTLPQGQARSAQAAIDMFRANYRETSRDRSSPDVAVQFGVSEDGSRTVDVKGTAHLLTLFLQILPAFADGRFEVHASAQALRSKLVMSIVLDRSGSMRNNSGCVGLPPAVDTFINFFDDQIDRAALVTFASNARTDVPMRGNFKSAIMAAIPRNCPDYDGWTFFDGGLKDAYDQNEGVIVASGEQIVKVVVFFTDGLANTFQAANLDCPPMGTWNLTGADVDGDQDFRVWMLDPVTGAQVSQSEPEFGGPQTLCPSLTRFTSITGAQRALVGADAAANVRLEAQDCARETARRLRVAGNTVYTIGLGTNLDPSFLKEIANDRTSPSFDPLQPVGEFALAPTAADLQTVFQKIARRILVRISI